jgi:ATP-binding cassette subfamily C protein
MKKSKISVHPQIFLSSIRFIFSLLTQKEKMKFYTLGFFQMTLGFLDILGVAAIGVLGSLAINGIQSKPGSLRVQWIMAQLGAGNLTFQWQVAVLGLLAGFVLILRTVLSIFLTRQILYFLSGKAARVSGSLASNIISSSYQNVKNIPKQNILFSISSGVNHLFIGVLGNLSSLGSDFFLLVSMLITLLIVDTTVAFSSMFLFGSISIALYFTLQKKARNLGIENAKLTVVNNESILDALQLFREINLRNVQSEFSGKIALERNNLAINSARSAFLPNISKYVIEIALVAGTVLIAATQFIQRDAIQAVSVLSIFLASGSRIAPAILRIQQNAISMKSSLGASGETVDFLKNFNVGSELRERVVSSSGPRTTSPRIEFKNVSFSYESDTRVLRDVNFEISPGESVALIGPSGSGKSTLVDLLLGMLSPTTGEVLIDGTSPVNIANTSPGFMAYVPQNIHIFNGSVEENITLLEHGSADADTLEKVIRESRLEPVVANFPEGSSRILGEGGNNLSGGQKQRIGIARALYTNPRLLVLDEATSSLDGITEMEITDFLGSIRGNITSIVIAHRLTSILNCDRVVYLDNGAVIGIGSLIELGNQIPDLEKQLRNILLVRE